MDSQVAEPLPEIAALRAALAKHALQKINDPSSRELVKIVAEYSGSGDDGMVDDVSGFDADDESVPLGELAEFAKKACYAYLEFSQPGWENDDGASGTFTIDVKTGAITLEHDAYYMQSEHSSKTIAATAEETAATGELMKLKAALAKRQLQKTVNPNLPDLVSIRAEYNGSGDSGMVEDAIGVDADGNEVPLDELSELASNACYAYLEQVYPGWEINEGASGTFSIDVKTGEVSLEHDSNYRESEHVTERISP